MLKFKMYCINLYEREDRYKYMKNQFKKHKLKVKFIRNYKHKFGGKIGCFESHIQCIKDAKENNVDICLIFKDDVELVKNCKEIIYKCIKFINSNKNTKLLFKIKM